MPGSQSLLATFATNAPEFVGELVSLDKPVVTIGRRADNDIVRPRGHGERRSMRQLKWQNATWIVEDIGLDQRDVRRPHLRAPEGTST